MTIGNVGDAPGWVMDRIAQTPWQGQLVLAFVVIGLLWRLSLIVKGWMPISKDTTRLYTHSQRMAATARCGGRCEHKPMFWFRCRETNGLQGDHVYPWSKGGQTIESNLQMLCGPHNRRKTNSVPSRLYIKRLEHRRKRYFPAGADPKVRWKA